MPAFPPLSTLTFIVVTTFFVSAGADLRGECVVGDGDRRAVGSAGDSLPAQAWMLMKGDAPVTVRGAQS